MFRSGQKGFTIGELAAVIALWSVIGAIAVPVASTLLAQHRLATSARQLAFEVARARMEAVGQNAYVRIVVVGSGQYARERSTDGVSFMREATVSLPSGFSLRAGDTGTPRFDRQGLAAAATTLTISSTRGERRVTTNVLGRVATS